MGSGTGRAREPVLSWLEKILYNADLGRYPQMREIYWSLVFRKGESSMSLVTLHWPKYLVLVISPVEKSKVVSEILTTLVMWDMARETHCFLWHPEYCGRTAMTWVCVLGGKVWRVGRKEEMRKRQIKISKSIKGMRFLLIALRASAWRPPMSFRENLTRGSPHWVCRHA